MRVLNAKIHGCLDYVVVVGFAVAPSLLGLAGAPALISYALAGVHLGLTLVTKFPLGLIKVLPLKIHGLIELVVGPTLVALPWVAGFGDVEVARNFFVGAGIVVFITWLVTDYQSA